ncbi:HEAT repeat domain-containing protein [Microseira sp. BLCC-F43]|uniref:HEAT repeat domain-containing protein n=1 Tax=Microseira sp. BLCC-F43 TaxID=3153602 RepID=UPI0035BB3FC0
MESWRHWDDFLKIMSRDNQLTDAETESFLLQFDRQNIDKKLKLKEIAAQLPLMEDALANHKKRMSEIYGKFSQKNGIELKPKNNKSKPLQKWLETKYSQWLPVQNSDSALSSATTETPIDWREICRDRLEKQKQLTTNRLMLAKAMVFNLDDIDVDLALVERKKPDKRSGDDRPEKSRFYLPDYEETEKLEYQEFLAKLLKSNQSNKIAVIGEAGAGKTTLLQRIAFWLLENTDYLPIWIPLGNLPNPAPQLKEYLLNRWLEDVIFSVTPEIRANFEKQLTAGKVWLLLDGVDEMAASGNPLTFVDKWIPAWSQHLPVMLTCRLNVWEANPYALNGFQTYRTLWFSEEKVKQFIHNGFQKSDPELGVQLQEALNQPGKERIKDLVRNPLRLMLLCSIWHLLDGKLPDTKAELYQHYVEEVYRWKEEEFPTTSEERKQLNAKLGELAKEAIDQQENRFCLRMDLVKALLGEGSLFQLALKVGWLNQVGVDAKNPLKSVYAFYHPTFQEYFAATAIDDWDFFLPRQHQDKPVADKYRIFESQWKEVILLWLGREDVESDQKEEFIKALVEFDDGCKKFYRYRAYFLAAVGIAEFKKCSIATKILKQIVKFGFGDFNEEKQVWVPYLEPIVEGARAALLQTKSEIAIEKLTGLIRTNEDENICGPAAHILGKIDPGNLDAIAAFVRFLTDTHVRILTDTQYLYTRWITAHILGKIGTGNPDAIAALLHVLETNTEDNIRRAAAYSLGKIAQGNYYAIERSLELLKSNKNQDILRKYINQDIRRKCAYILGEIAQENPNAKKALVKLLDSTESDDIRWRAADILGTLYPGNTESKQALVKLLDSTKHDFIRWRAADILGTLYPGNPEAKEELVQILKTTEYWDIRWQAAESLGKIDPGNPDAIDALVELLKTTENGLFSKSTADSLAEIAQENPQAMAASFRIMGGLKSSNIPIIAADILGKIAQGNSDAIAGLVQILKTNEHDRVHSIVADTLGKIAQGNSDALAALSVIIDTTKYLDIRIRAAENLGKIDPVNDRAIKALVEIIGNPESGYLRITATDSLQKIAPGNTDAKDILVKLLKTTEDRDICIRAAESLGKIDPGNPQAIKAVEKLLENTEDDIRLITADNLETIDSGNTQAMALVRHWYVADKLEKIDPGNSQAINALVELLEKTDDENIRFRVANSLREIGKGNPDAIAPLFRLLATTKYENIREIATYKLG